MKILRLTVCSAFLFISGQVFAQAVPQNPLTDDIRAIRLQQQLQALDKHLARSSAPLDGPLKANTISPLTSLQATVKGTFWRNPDWVKLLDLSADQQKKMDDLFQQYRLKLVDLTASLQKEELILEPFLGAGRPAPDAESKILTQIDRIADARAELEKANSKMLISILQVLSADQWSKLPIPSKKGISIFTKPGK